MLKIRLAALAILVLGCLVGYFIFYSEQPGNRFPFKLGLDLRGGTHLTYRANVSEIPKEDVRDAMDSLRDVIERRVNLFGVAEPIVQVERTAGIISESAEERLIVELPGVTDIDEAIAMIGQTPLLDFRLERPSGPLKEKAIADLR